MWTGDGRESVERSRTARGSAWGRCASPHRSLRAHRSRSGSASRARSYRYACATSGARGSPARTARALTNRRAAAGEGPRTAVEHARRAAPSRPGRRAQRATPVSRRWVAGSQEGCSARHGFGARKIARYPTPHFPVALGRRLPRGRGIKRRQPPSGVWAVNPGTNAVDTDRDARTCLSRHADSDWQRTGAADSNCA